MDKLNDLDKGHLNTALSLYRDSVRRQMVKHPTGSALHTAYSSTLAEIETLLSRFFSLKGSS